ncbi:YybH family protein [Undibacterium sp. TJN25]|uniref:YybH family protein n=1 Tax=Undibacterium sp. TJN25 TaxID=3413056 RepID=UPI003BF1C223
MNQASPQLPLQRAYLWLLVTTFAVFAAMLLPAPGYAAQPTMSDVQKQVADTERAFAKTMALRDHAGFTSFLSEEAVFFSGQEVLRGKQNIADAWKRLYQKPEAPFSWEPEQVEVLASGTLALSSGPVRDPQGKLIATFTSIWRLEAPGTWRIIFDKGNDACDCGNK